MVNINFRKTNFFAVVAKIEDCPTIDYPEIVLAGRSNVGKSSFINAIGDNKNLAKISSKPGKTRLLVYFTTDEKILFTDLPGYGFSLADKSQKKDYKNLVDNYLTSTNRNFSLIIHFVDIRHTPPSNDVMMSEWLKASGFPFMIVLTKADKLSAINIKKRVNEIRNELSLGENIPVFPLGNKDGIKPIQEKITKILFK